jgi:hypothetical protein
MFCYKLARAQKEYMTTKVILPTTVYCLTYADYKREARSCIRISIWCEEEEDFSHSTQGSILTNDCTYINHIIFWSKFLKRNTYSRK